MWFADCSQCQDSVRYGSPADALDHLYSRHFQTLSTDRPKWPTDDPLFVWIRKVSPGPARTLSENRIFPIVERFIDGQRSQALLKARRANARRLLLTFITVSCTSPLNSPLASRNELHSNERYINSPAESPARLVSPPRARGAHRNSRLERP